MLWRLPLRIHQQFATNSLKIFLNGFNALITNLGLGNPFGRGRLQSLQLGGRICSRPSTRQLISEVYFTSHSCALLHMRHCLTPRLGPYRISLLSPIVFRDEKFLLCQCTLPCPPYLLCPLIISSLHIKCDKFEFCLS